MKISIKNKRILLEEVFNQIELVTPDGEIMLIQMRDGKFEVAVEDKTIKSTEALRYFIWYSVDSEGFKELYTEPAKEEDGNGGVTGG